MTKVEKQTLDKYLNGLSDSGLHYPEVIDPNATKHKFRVTEKEKNKALRVLSEVVANMKYARYLPEKKRRETWPEIVDRVKGMHLKKFAEKPEVCRGIEHAFSFVLERKVLPAMRTLQFGGLAMEKNNMRGFNCTYMPIKESTAFNELMYVLLSGAGVGYDVQKNHIRLIPAVRKSVQHEIHVVDDSIEGWADAIKALMFGYLEGKPVPVFDYTKIRPQGAPLITSGGQAPGPGPLIEAVENVTRILDSVPYGSQLTSLNVHDIICHLANCVVVAGTRRSSLICLFDIDDEEMLNCKSGDWGTENPQRGRANNSVILNRHTVTYEEFTKFWDLVKKSKYGEPGIYFTNNPDEWGTNPCGEIALRHFQACNLVEINGSNIVSQEDFNERAKVAAFIATLQASYTNFEYLGEKWMENTVKDALLGIGITGIMTGNVERFSLFEASECAVAENVRVADMIGINRAARCCTVKPSGTTSLFLDCSCGIHDEIPANMRRILVNKDEPMYSFFEKYCPELIEEKHAEKNRDTSNLAFLDFPIKLNLDSYHKLEDAETFLTRVLRFSNEWIVPGHIDGDNTHNVSSTINVRKHEWDYVKGWLWEHRFEVSGITVFPYEQHAFKQPPYDICDEEKVFEMFKHIQKIDLGLLSEDKDNTTFMKEAVCSSGFCERRESQ